MVNVPHDTKTSQPRVCKDSPDVSVLVCTYNRAKFLADALRGLRTQDTGGRFDYEIVVVDNASNDDTRNVVEQITKDSPVPIRYVFEPHPGIAYARNRSMQEARAEWFASFDDDQIPGPDWLKELYLFALSRGAKCVGGAVLPDISEETRAALGPAAQGALRAKDYGGTEPRKYAKRDYPGTGNLLLHRSVCEMVGSFDTSNDIGGTDYDFLRRTREAGFDAWYVPTAVIWHRYEAHRLTPEYFEWDALQCGSQLAYFDFKYRGPWKTFFLCIARIGQALILNLPRWLIALARGQRESAMIRKSLLRRAEGYTRRTLGRLAPWLYSDEKFLQNLNRRNGRTVGLAAAETSGPSKHHVNEHGPGTLPPPTSQYATEGSSQHAKNQPQRDLPALADPTATTDQESPEWR